MFVMKVFAGDREVMEEIQQYAILKLDAVTSDIEKYELTADENKDLQTDRGHGE